MVIFSNKLKSLLTLFLALLITVVNAQRLSFGFNYDFMALHYTSFSEDVIFSNRTYRAFYVEKHNTNLSMTMAASYLTVVDYGRFSLFLDMGIFNETDGAKIKLKYPVANEEFNTYYSRVKNGGYRINSILYYSFNTPTSFKPAIGAGMSNMFPIEVSEDVSTVKDFAKAWYDVYEIKSNYKPSSGCRLHLHPIIIQQIL